MVSFAILRNYFESYREAGYPLLKKRRWNEIISNRDDLVPAAPRACRRFSWSGVHCQNGRPCQFRSDM